MSISDLQYQQWLFRDEQRCVLIEANAYSGGAEVTRYISNRAYLTQPTDTPANTPYDDVLLSVPTYTAKLSEIFTGRSIPDWGDLIISNESGVRDSWFSDAWDGRSLKMYLGGPTWARSDFRQILGGVVVDITSPRRDQIGLKVTDKSWMLNVPAQTTLMGGTTASADQPQPLCYGTCFNVEPVLEDAATWKYRVHQGAINAITDVRASGVSVGHTDTLASGYFNLLAAPAGRITCDVQGAKPSGTYLTKCADIVQDLVTSHSSLTTADIDATNFTAFNTTCAQALNLYVRDRANLIDLIDQLVTSVGGFWTFSRSGLLRLGRLAAPTGTYSLALTADDIRALQLSIERRDLPIATERLGYQKNWTPQADGLAGSVTTANRALYGAPYLVAKGEDLTLFTAHKLSRQPNVAETLIALQADANTEATRVQALFNAPRTVYNAAAYVAPYTLNLGDEVQLTHPRFGFSAGANAIVVGIVEEITRNRATLELWK